MHLDRDDVGFRSDTVSTPNGIIEFKENREVVTLRGTSAGEYVVNVHLYGRRSKEPHQPIPVSIRLEKMTPFKIEAAREVVLIEKGEEKTAFRFVLNSDGEVISLNYLEKPIAVQARGQEG